MQNCVLARLAANKHLRWLGRKTWDQSLLSPTIAGIPRQKALSRSLSSLVDIVVPPNKSRVRKHVSSGEGPET